MRRKRLESGHPGYRARPALGELVLRFGSPEVFALALFGLTLIAGLSGPRFLKGLASGAFGWPIFPRWR